MPDLADGVSYSNPPSADGGSEFMSEYTIRRGQRTFRAKKLETLRELVRRGYLGPDDAVSVDGGPFGPVGALDGLRESDDPAAPSASWIDAREETADVEPEEAGDLLSDFLSGLQDDEGPPRPAPPSGPRAPAASWITREQAPTPAELARIDAPLDVLTAGNLEPLDPVDVPSPPQPSSVTEESPPPRASSSGSFGGLRLVEPEPEQSAPPLSFGSWMDQKGGSPAGELLEKFGVVDDGIVLRAQRRRGPNWWRTAGIVLVGAAIIGLWHTWVRTVALTSYPTEAELVSSQQGDGPAIPGEVARKPVRNAAPQTALDIERRLKPRVVGDIQRFASADELENVMFAELINLGVKPLGVDVDALRVKASGDYDRDRPIEADITIRLAGIDEEESVAEMIQERITLSWFVTAKYSLQGKVNFRQVRTSFGPPSPYQNETEGKELLALWTGRRSAKDLLLKD